MCKSDEETRITIRIAVFKKNENKRIAVFIDAVWAGFVDDRRFITGYSTVVFGNLVIWKSKSKAL